jgi:hypothetical protein
MRVSFERRPFGCHFSSRTSEYDSAAIVDRLLYEPTDDLAVGANTDQALLNLFVASSPLVRSRRYVEAMLAN